MTLLGRYGRRGGGLLGRARLPGMAGGEDVREGAAAVSVTLLAPSTVAQWSGATAVTITGAGFTDGSVAYVDDVAVPTSVTSAGELVATLPAAESLGSPLRTAGAHAVRVDASSELELTVSAWDLASIATGTAWHDADPAYVTTVGGLVSQWADRLAGARHLVQATPAAQCVYDGADAELNGRGAVSFLGNDYMQSVPLTQLLAASGGWALSVVRVSAIDTNSGIAYVDDAIWSDTGGFVGQVLRSAGPTYSAYAWDGGQKVATRTMSTGSVEVLTWRLEGGQLTGRRNLFAESAATACGDIASRAGTFTVGRSSSSNYLTGKVAELFIAGGPVALADRERAIRRALVRYRP